MTSTVIDQARWTPTEHDDPLRTGGALDGFAASPHRVASFSRNHVCHGVSADSPPDPALLRTLRPLRGKFTIVNPMPALPLPDLVERRVRRLVRAAARRPGADAGLVVLLQEPAERLVVHERSSAALGEVRFRCELTYRVLVAAGAGTAEAAAAAPLRRVARRLPWFVVSVLTPDAEAMQIMQPATRQLYRHVTGRLRDGSPDSYWHADTWERYHEPGRIAGCIRPDEIDHAIRARRRPPGGGGAPEESFLFAPPSGERSLFGDYSPQSDRRFYPPPGYCLIRYYCWLELALADGGARRRAA